MLKNNKKIIILSALVLMTSAVLKSRTITSEKINDQKVTEQAIEQEEKTMIVSYEANEDGQNAFDLLKITTEIEYKEYDFGVFVQSINGIESNDKSFWSLYVNGEQSQTGADQTFLKKGDQVEWRYEEIK